MRAIKTERITGIPMPQSAAERSLTVKAGRPSLDHVYEFENELKKAGIDTGRTSPVFLPDYTKKEVK